MELELIQGKVAQIDDAHRPRIAFTPGKRPNWDGRWYAHAAPIGAPRSAAEVRLHNLILDLKWVDHIDGNGLNNRRSNLKPCTNALNQQNSGSRCGSSQYEGVSWNTRKGSWLVQFRFDGRYHYVGYFRDEDSAAHAYDAAVLPLAGEFARLNFPKGA